MGKLLFVLLGFVIGFFLSWQMREVDSVLLYLLYRIHGPKGLHVMEDVFVGNPIPAVSLIVVVVSVVYLVVANARIKSENKKQKKKRIFPP